MSTSRTMKACPGTLAPKRRVDALVGLDAHHQGVGAEVPALGRLGKARCGTPWNWRATSVTRLGRRLPVRM